MIESINNEKIKQYAKLKEKKYREQESMYLVTTPHLVQEAVKKGVVKEIFLLESKENNYGDVTFVTTNVMKKLSNLDTPPEVVAVVYKENKKEIKGNVLLLDAIQDPGNLGTIIRSAVAFNIDTIILGNGCVDLYNEKVLRAAEGMHLNVNIFNDDLNTIIPTLKEQNYQVIGTKLSNGLELSEFKPKEKYALIMGNEGSGVSENILNMCDDYVYIKMNQQCESLNVGVATSIILYGFNKNL